MRFGVRDENSDSECRAGGRRDEKGPCVRRESIVVKLGITWSYIPCVRRESIVVKLKNHGGQRGEYNV
jgi:hypothetical protein